MNRLIDGYKAAWQAMVDHAETMTDEHLEGNLETQAWHEKGHKLYSRAAEAEQDIIDRYGFRTDGTEIDDDPDDDELMILMFQ